MKKITFSNKVKKTEKNADFIRNKGFIQSSVVNKTKIMYKSNLKHQHTYSFWDGEEDTWQF